VILSRIGFVKSGEKPFSLMKQSQPKMQQFRIAKTFNSYYFNTVRNSSTRDDRHSTRKPVAVIRTRYITPLLIAMTAVRSCILNSLAIGTRKYRTFRKFSARKKMIQNADIFRCGNYQRQLRATTSSDVTFRFSEETEGKW